MLEVLAICILGGILCQGIFTLLDATAGPWDLRSDEARAFDRERKWGINRRVMRWLIPTVIAGIVAYGFYLKLLGVIQ